MRKQDSIDGWNIWLQVFHIINVEILVETTVEKATKVVNLKQITWRWFILPSRYGREMYDRCHPFNTIWDNFDRKCIKTLGLQVCKKSTSKEIFPEIRTIIYYKGNVYAVLKNGFSYQIWYLAVILIFIFKLPEISWFKLSFASLKQIKLQLKCICFDIKD